MTSELNIKIAKRLGYTADPVGFSNPRRYMLQDANEEAVTGTEHKTESDVWVDAPDWSGDISLALELVGDRKLQLDNRDSGWTARIGTSLTDAHVGSGATAAEAICWAWTHIDLDAEKKARDIEKLKERISANVRELDRLVGKPVFRLVPIGYDAPNSALDRGDIDLDPRPENCKINGHSWVSLKKGGGYYGCEMCGATVKTLDADVDWRPTLVSPEYCIAHRIIKPMSGIGGFCVDCGIVLK